jgi:hypothetical protein
MKGIDDLLYPVKRGENGKDVPKIVRDAVMFVCTVLAAAFAYDPIWHDQQVSPGKPGTVPIWVVREVWWAFTFAVSVIASLVLLCRLVQEIRFILLVNAAMECEANRDLGGASKRYYKAWNIRAHDRFVLMSLGGVLFARGLLHDSIAMYMRAVAHDADDVPALNNLGVVLSANKEYQDAVKVLEVRSKTPF